MKDRGEDGRGKEDNEEYSGEKGRGEADRTAARTADLRRAEPRIWEESRADEK